MDLLDRLDPRGFDAEEITHLLNAFDEFSEAEQTAAFNASEREELLESDCIALDGADPVLLQGVIDQLPVAPGPVRSH